MLNNLVTQEVKRELSSFEAIFPSKSVKLGKKLGSGAFGVVYRLVYSDTNKLTDYVLKLPKSDEGVIDNRAILREFDNTPPSSKEKHNLVQFDNDRVGLILPYAGCEIQDFVNTHIVDTKGSIVLVLKIFIQLLDQLKQVHDAGFAHGDVRSPNIFVKLDKKKNPKVTLGDFGVAHKLGTPYLLNFDKKYSGMDSFLRCFKPSIKMDIFALCKVFRELLCIVRQNAPFFASHLKSLNPLLNKMSSLLIDHSQTLSGVKSKVELLLASIENKNFNKKEKSLVSSNSDVFFVEETSIVKSIGLFTLRACSAAGIGYLAATYYGAVAVCAKIGFCIGMAGGPVGAIIGAVSFALLYCVYKTISALFSAKKSPRTNKSTLFSCLPCNDGLVEESVPNLLELAQ